MVRRFALLALLGFAVAASASESGVLAARAHRSMDAGKFAKSYNQLERALLASRKESNLQAEGRILMSMAQIRTMSFDLDLADSLLSIIHENALNDESKIMLDRSKIALLNARENYKQASQVCAQMDKELLDDIDDPLQAAVHSECAIAWAGAGNASEAAKALKNVGSCTSKKSGFYAMTAGRIADLQGKSDADTLYRYAEAKSIENGYPYMTASMLYYRANLKSTPEKERADLKLRCKNAFELMGLPNNAKKCAE